MQLRSSHLAAETQQMEFGLFVGLLVWWGRSLYEFVVMGYEDTRHDFFVTDDIVLSWPPLGSFDWRAVGLSEFFLLAVLRLCTLVHATGGGYVATSPPFPGVVVVAHTAGLGEQN